MPRGGRPNRAFRPGTPRGQGRGRRRGSRGGFPSGREAHEEEEQGGGAVVFEGHFEDFTLDHVMPRRTRSAGVTPARAHRGYQTPPRGYQTPPRGFQPRGRRRGGGIGFSGNTSVVGGVGGGGAPRAYHPSLSMLERDRPLLRPLTFVRGENQKTLFEEVEEILRVPGEEGGGVENHVPSADVVERLFNAQDTPPAEAEPAAAAAASGADESGGSASDSEELDGAAATDAARESLSTFIIDTTPSPIVLDSHPRQVPSGPAPLGAPESEDEVIVYVAPHPRTDHSTPAIPSPALNPLLTSSQPPPTLPTQPTTSGQSTPAIPTGDTPPAVGRQSRVLQAYARTRFGLKQTPRSRKIAKKERAAARRRAEREAILGMNKLNDAQSSSLPPIDPRRAERRWGDSDVDWGTESDGGVEEVGHGLGEMELDPDLTDMAAFARFARGVRGGEVVTIADIEDAARMAEEDAVGDGSGDESEEGSDVFGADEGGDGEGGSDSDGSLDDDDDEAAGRSVQSRVHKMRERAKKRAAVADAGASSAGGDTDDDDDDSFSDSDFAWADRDERFYEGIEDLLDENESILRGGDRKSRNKLFKAIQSEFGDDLNMRGKDRSVPAHLREQWARDRARKAQRKRLRELARLEAAAEYSVFKSSRKKKKKKEKEKEKIYGSARFEGDTFITNRISDMAVLEQQIRTFVRNLELKTMVLPPMDKEWRRRAHLLADAFNLKSKSKGRGEERFATLTKTTRSGTGVNARKISQLVYGHVGGEEGFQTPPRVGRPTRIRNRDGEEVGKMAPKLSETNVGFRLLQQMGWEEGDRIGGVTGGLVDPLTAIIKTTKLGLGASR